MDKIKLFIVFDVLTAILWGVLTNQLFGTLWYWVAGISLAALSEFWVRKVKKLSAQKAVALGFEFGLSIAYRQAKITKENIRSSKVPMPKMAWGLRLYKAAFGSPRRPCNRRGSAWRYRKASSQSAAPGSSGRWSSGRR